ncbi:diguanylate cyclase (GGDEF) domain-containing protein [Ruminococcus sp. YE71]|uniref:sensor domain-containing diguanylate cyclase n=1 Tax=unclassified Ruminococcus TaxID=2608920 RepID=UPI00087F8194|nr:MULTISPECIES: GGDEF domain-containing protein [unclassified Ruminococcus]SDA20588.1 diguanylate cyclase (GGDEF) domain-containing protein [Ruminococcus sp. YE78]SFW33988.1 diguanylate cyclase (GGDEF) domain-containing protein [Ruminococcus sp. YE71]
MDFQQWIESMIGLASVYAFDIMPDGSFSEIRLMALNKKNAAIIARNPKAPKFYPGIPWRSYFTDVNFESFCYRCGSTCKPLYSYVNAHGFWLKGFYLPVLTGETPESPDSPRTVYVLYVLDHSKEMDTDAMSHRSAETSAAVINISIKLHETQDFIQSMSETIAELRKVCGSELCSLLTVDRSEHKCTFINEYGTQPELLEIIAKGMKCTPYEVAFAWENDLAGSDCLLLDDLSVIKERDPLWYESLCDFKINSIVLYSVRFSQTVVGFIWAANFDKTKMMHIKETLELTSFLIGAVIANHQLLSKLEIKSNIDELTQVGSRNFMNTRIKELKSDKSKLPETFGLVFADLNGLKTVNDTEGHAAGDKLLSRAASLLKLAFGDHEIYRAGGDEFVVFCPNITEEAFERQTAQLRALADTTDDVSFAVGTEWISGDIDIDSAMDSADAKMYEDKNEFYRQHPEKDRRRNNGQIQLH